MWHRQSKHPDKPSPQANTPEPGRSEEALRASEARFRTFVDHALDGFFLVDDQLKVVDVNRQACESLGYNREELIGLHPRDFDVDLEQIAIERLRQRTAAGETLNFETQHRRRDGTVFPVEIRARQLEQGGRTYILSLVRDITERKRTEEERTAYLWFLESLDRINRAMQGTKDIENMISDVLGIVLETFACDRAWVYECDVVAPMPKMSVERTRPEFPGFATLGRQAPLDAELIKRIAELREIGGTVTHGPGCHLPVPPQIAEHWSVRSQILMVIGPKVDQPYVFGLHQCSHPRVWTSQEQGLFQEIGRRLNDALENHLAMRSLRESERRLDLAQRIAHVGYWDRDLDTDHMALSDEGYRIFGLPKDERVLDVTHWRARWLDLIHPEDRPRIAEATEAALHGGSPYEVEYRVVRSGGDVRIVHSRGEVTRDESGKPRRMFGVMQDITELRRAEEELRVSEARFRTFADHATDAFFVFDDQLNVLDVNRQACKSLGYSREELIGMHPRDFDICTDERVFERLTQLMVQLPDGGEAPTFESYHRRKDGSLFAVEVRGRRFELGGRRFLATARDITERKQAEVVRLEASVAERTRIARDLHDTLLQTFQGSLLQFRAALRLISKQPDRAREVLASAIDQAAHGIKEGRETVHGLRASAEEPNDLGASIRRLAKELSLPRQGSHAPSVRVVVEGKLDALLPVVRTEVFWVASEALRNTFDHAHATQVEVELRYDARQFRLRVRDNGQGIDPKLLAEGGREGHFGLRGMRERAELAGGELTVWSAPGSGTEVELVISGSKAYGAGPSTAHGSTSANSSFVSRNED
jgi:PAS domain S-box-containing protein